MGKEVSGDTAIPEEAVSMIQEFQDVFPEDLPDRLPPQHDV